MLKISVVILTVMLAFGGVYSVMTFAIPAFFVGEGFEATTGRTLESVQDEGYVDVLLSTERHVGAFAVASTLAGFFILFGAFRKAEAWGWWALLIVGLISWGWGLVENITHASTMNIIMHGAGTLVFLVGLLLPVGVFFGKKA